MGSRLFSKSPGYAEEEEPTLPQARDVLLDAIEGLRYRACGIPPFLQPP